MNPWGPYWLFGSFGLLFGLLAAFKWWWNLQVRAPIAEKLLRPPGESLRRQLETIDEGITLWIALYAMAAASVLALPATMRQGTATIAFSGVALVLLAIAAARLVILLKRRRDYALGFSGERLVGEELGKLAREGFHVFHDIPADGLGNIDHVVVSSSGVFAVETKTRRKRSSAPGGKGYLVVFDGYALQFPHCKDSHGLEQARRNAEWLGAYLTKATGEPVQAEAILTLPGWYIQRRGKGAVRVLNHKELRSGLNGQARLTPERVQRIAHQLDQRCRDVEF